MARSLVAPFSGGGISGTIPFVATSALIRSNLHTLRHYFRFARHPGALAITSYKRTSMIGLCQEGKSSPDALRRSACTKLFVIPRRVCWPLSRGSFFQIRTRLPFAASAFQLHRRLSLCFLPVSKLINGGIQSLRS